jgi:hypothetical protein
MDTLTISALRTKLVLIVINVLLAAPMAHADAERLPAQRYFFA